MAESISMNKVIHGAVRRDIARFAGALAAFDALEQAPTAEHAQRAAAIATLHEVAEQHLEHEERELEPVYWAHHDAPLIRAIGRRYSQRSPFRSGDFLAWLMNGASTEERTALRKDVPPPVLAIFPKLFGRYYRRRVAPTWR